MAKMQRNFDGEQFPVIYHVKEEGDWALLVSNVITAQIPREAGEAYLRGDLTASDALDVAFEAHRQAVEDADYLRSFEDSDEEYEYHSRRLISERLMYLRGYYASL